jgi:hypothetical protein
MSKPTSNGRAWAYGGTILGALVSIAANVAHSFVAPADASATWRPPTGEILFAAFWPIALFVAIEMLARVAWREGWRFGLLRFGGLVPVAGTAAIVSYLHLAGLLAHYGEPRVTVVIGPLAVDGLMVMSAAALMSTTPGARPDTHDVSMPDTETVETVDEVPPQVPDSDPDTDTGKIPDANPPRTPVKRTGKKAADRVAAQAAKTPDMSAAEMAKKLKLSERTIRRHLPDPAPDTDTAVEPEVDHVNGEPVLTG